MCDARHAQFSAFIRDLAIRQARVLARCPPYFMDVECPDCGAYFAIDASGLDQHVSCPECGERWDAWYDADGRPDGTFRGGYTLRRAG